MRTLALLVMTLACGCAADRDRMLALEVSAYGTAFKIELCDVRHDRKECD